MRKKTIIKVAVRKTWNSYWKEYAEAIALARNKPHVCTFTRSRRIAHTLVFLFKCFFLGEDYLFLEIDSTKGIEVERELFVFSELFNNRSSRGVNGESIEGSLFFSFVSYELDFLTVFSYCVMTFYDFSDFRSISRILRSGSNWPTF